MLQRKIFYIECCAINKLENMISNKCLGSSDLEPFMQNI